MGKKMNHNAFFRPQIKSSIDCTPVAEKSWNKITYESSTVPSR